MEPGEVPSNIMLGQLREMGYFTEYNPNHRWTRSEATAVIHGEVAEPRCFHYELHSGKAFGVTDALILTDKEIAMHFAKVDAADRKELEAFAKFKTCIARKAENLSNIIDCVWGRRWKQAKLSDGATEWQVKSRLCGRGFLDKQRFEVDKHSSTATRMSQRMALSIATQGEHDVQSWDISNAFLQGLSYKELQEKS